MTPKDADTCVQFWKHLQALAEIAHTRGGEGLVEILMEDFAHLSPPDHRLMRLQLSSLVTALPIIKQGNATRAAAIPATHKIPYRD